MTDRTFSVALDLPNLGNLPFTRDGLPHLARAVQATTEAAHALWQGYAAGAPLPSGAVIANRTGEYLRSILIRELGDFAGETFTDLPYAHVIEDGAPERDMKKMLGYSLKVRLTKDGKRYLIIPFRHNGPGAVMGNAMPQSVMNWWREPGRELSRVVGRYRRASGTGAFDIKTRQILTVSARKYVWGSRLTGGDLAGMGIAGQAAKRLEGMVHFRGRKGTTGARHGQYLTFRVMAEGGKGWIAKAQPGKHPAQAVADQIRPHAEQAFKAALEADLAAALGGVVE